MKPKSLAIVLLSVVLAGLALAAWHYRGWFHSLTPASLRAFLVHWGFWKGAILFFAIYTFSIRPFVPIPPTLYTITGGLAFGPLWGALLTIFGATANASITFCIGRYLGMDWIKSKLHGKWKEGQEKLTGAGFKTVFLIRLSPIGPPFDLVSYAAGVLGVKFSDYVLGTLLGIIPATAAYSYFGGSLSRGAVGVLIALFGISFFSLALPWLWKKRRG